MADKQHLVLYEGFGKWSALYVDGKLETVGDHYLAQEKIYRLCGVTIVQSNDFMRGGQNQADLAQTLEELDAYSCEREDILRKVTTLRDEANLMLAEANVLEKKYK